ncbi:energy-coupling factor transporter ATPase [Serpentinicella sp. ANB-PHB4]|uniref:ABC transporter ATP-binding protein n=1 Tax=Serpentinicella sp. ANB-PHB4 TaxID=3074076 RepID=UPI002865CD59|nr:energy-coupling factor transporter ATPase [Serpentinicella sp. ANB-PHB4]MDR5659303.1 energy-coupling factor transporter ATPase [Serpentinicella sp. ANB-PHB4]
MFKIGGFSVENLTYMYPDENNPALDHVNLNIGEGSFTLVMGSSGSGKSTLLLALANLLPDYYGGRIKGKIKYDHKNLSDWDKKEIAAKIAYVFQDPEQQIVMTTVEQEIAFGLENLGIEKSEMKRRITEVLTLLNLTKLRHENVFNLSGGEKQKLVIAALLAMQPKVLLLDEPTSQLDPLMADEIMSFIYRLNKEWGITVVLIEQRIDRCFHLADQVLLMDKSKVKYFGKMDHLVYKDLGESTAFLPPITQIFKAVDLDEVPSTVSKAREILSKKTVKKEAHIFHREKNYKQRILEINNLSFHYPNRKDSLKNINLNLSKTQITVLVGENGAGKSTLFKNIIGVLMPQKGKIMSQNVNLLEQNIQNRSKLIGFLSQNPNDYLFNETVYDEVGFTLDKKLPNRRVKIEGVLKTLDLLKSKDCFPRDLSGGERQRVALASVLVTNPEIILLDEPTRGLDPLLKKQLGESLVAYKQQGKSVFLITHDIEFATEIADRVIMMSNGEIIADDTPDNILTKSLYYTSQVNRLFRDYSQQALRLEEGKKFLHSLLR